MPTTTFQLTAKRVITSLVAGGNATSEYTSLSQTPYAGVNSAGNAQYSLLGFALPSDLINGTINSATLSLGAAFADGSASSSNFGRSVIGVPANTTAFASQDILNTTLGSNVRYIADSQYVATGAGQFADHSIPTYMGGAGLTNTPNLNINVLAMLTQAQSAGRLAGGVAQFVWRLNDRLFAFTTPYYQFGGAQAATTLTIDYTPPPLWVGGAGSIHVGKSRTLTLNRPGTSGALTATLSQSSGNVLSFPTNVTIEDGSNSKTFTVTGVAAGSSTITVTDGTNTATTTINVVDLTTNLISLWHLDEISGDATDSWGSNTLTANASPGSTTGKLSNCRTFSSASSQYFSVASNPSLLTGNIDFTFSGWVYLTSVPANNDAYSLITKYTDVPANSRDYNIDFYRIDSSPSSGGFRFYFNGSGNGTLVIVSTGYAAYSTTGQWYHLVAWHDAAADTINLQVNGTLFSANTSGNVPQTGSGQFRLGARPFSGFVNPLNGRLDEVGFWKRKLTADERAYLFNNGDGNLVADFNLWITGQETVRLGQSTPLTANRANASGSLDVNLSQTPSGLLTFSDPVTIPSGSTSQSFNVTGVALGTTTLTATAGSDTFTKSIRILPLGLGSEVLWLCPSQDAAGNGTTTVTDFSGNGLNGALTNFALTGSSSNWVSDTGNGGVRAIDFDGTNDRVVIPDSDLLSFTNGSGQDLPFSIGAWLYLRGYGGGSSPFAPILSKYSSYSPFVGEWMFYVDATGQLMVQVLSGTTANRLLKASTPLVPQNQWVHVGATYSGNETHAGLKLYINGAEVATTTSGSGHTGVSNRTGEVSVGAALYDGETTYRGFLNGRLDDIRLCNVELTGGNMATLASTTRVAAAGIPRTRINGSLINAGRINLGLTR